VHHHTMVASQNVYCRVCGCVLSGAVCGAVCVAVCVAVCDWCSFVPLRMRLVASPHNSCKSECVYAAVCGVMCFVL